MCSNIVRLADWKFDENLWVIGGIFLDDMVTIFDYEERKVGFADIPTPDSSPTNTATSITTPAAGAPPPVAPTESRPPKLVASDISTLAVPPNRNAPGGREFSQLVTFSSPPLPQIATGFNSLDLSYQHVRAITFATSNHPDSFRLHFNANADTDTHGTPGTNPNSDTVLRRGKAAWLQTLPSDPYIQVGRYSLGTPFPTGAWSAPQLPPNNTVQITFPQKFDAPPKIVLWLSGMDFSQAYNWRLAASASAITTTGFTLSIGPWEDTILYKADVSWIAHADVPGIQSGTFSTEDERGKGWQLETSVFKKFEKKFGEGKVPRFVAGLNKIEFGCGRDLKVETTTEVGVEGVKWSLNSAGNAHPYIMGAGWIAFDPVSLSPPTTFLFDNEKRLEYWLTCVALRI